MKVKRFSEATRYDAPKHHRFMGLLQGFESDGPKNQWVESHSPRRRRGPRFFALRENYVCLAGSVSVVVDGVEFVLNPMDSCTVAPNEVREIVRSEPCRDDVGRHAVPTRVRTRRPDCAG